MGFDPLRMMMFAITQRKHTPSAIMPWEWPTVKLSFKEQVVFELHMTWQYALEGRDWLRRSHPWGPHWFIQLWENSPNDMI